MNRLTYLGAALPKLNEAVLQATHLVELSDEILPRTFLRRSTDQLVAGCLPRFELTTLLFVVTKWCVKGSFQGAFRLDELSPHAGDGPVRSQILIELLNLCRRIETYRLDR